MLGSREWSRPWPLEGRLHPHTKGACAPQLQALIAVQELKPCVARSLRFSRSWNPGSVRIFLIFRHSADQTKAQLLCCSGPSFHSLLSRSESRAKLLAETGSSSFSTKQNRKPLPFDERKGAQALWWAVCEFTLRMFPEHLLQARDRTEDKAPPLPSCAAQVLPVREVWCSVWRNLPSVTWYLSHSSSVPSQMNPLAKVFLGVLLGAVVKLVAIPHGVITPSATFYNWLTWGQRRCLLMCVLQGHVTHAPHFRE